MKSRKKYSTHITYRNNRNRA